MSGRRADGARPNSGGGHRIHRFTEKDILGFIKRHPEEIKLGKIDQTWFLYLLVPRGVDLSKGAAPRSVEDANESEDVFHE
jgi:hypothetical protein